MNIGIYAGSFDPITRGHVDLIKRSLSFCDKLIVVIGTNLAKKTMFSVQDRVDFIREAIKDYGSLVTVDCTDGLIIDYAKSKSALMLIRGVRSVKDFEYETSLAQINKELAPELETILIPALPEWQNVSSSMVKELASYHVNVEKYVHTNVCIALNDIFDPDIL